MSAPAAAVPMPLSTRIGSWAQRAYLFLLPEERALFWVALATAFLCYSTGTGFTLRRVMNGYDNLFAYNMAMIFVVSRWIFWWRQRRPNPAVWSSRPDLGADLSMVRSTVFLLCYLTVYTNFKVRIPMLNSGTHDWALRMFERKVLFGVDAVDEFTSLQRFPVVVKFLDEVYHHGYLFMALVTLLLYVNHGPRHVRHLITSMGCMYLVGITITALWPTWGPCFWEPGEYRWLKELDLDSAGSQSMLRGQQKAALESFALAETRDVRAFSGIAAFPSLHVAHCLLLVRFAREYFPRVNYLLVPVTILTWVATLSLGWHYISDGLAAPFLVAGSWWLSQKLVFGEQNPPRVDAPPQAIA